MFVWVTPEEEREIMLRTDSGYERRISTFFIAIVTIILLVALWQIRSILMLAIAAVMLTVLASGPVAFFCKRGLGRGLAILLSMAIGVIMLVVLLLLVFPTLIAQFTTLFTSTVPNGINRLIELWNSEELFEQIPFLRDVVDSIDMSAITIDSQLINQAVEQVLTAVESLSGSVLPLLGNVASGALSLVIVFFLCIYLIAEPDRYINGVIALTPLWYRDRMREILARMGETIRSWLKVTGVSMIIVGAVTGLGMAVLDIEQWLALGVLTGMLSFIPNFGTIGALIPSVAVAIVQNPSATGLVVVIILGASFLQAQIVGPILSSESMNLPPVMVLVGQIVLGLFFGFWGLLLAVPLTAIAMVLVEEIYVKDVLGDVGGEKTKIDDADDVHLQPETD